MPLDRRRAAAGLVRSVQLPRGLFEAAGAVKQRSPNAASVLGQRVLASAIANRARGSRSSSAGTSWARQSAKARWWGASAAALFGGGLALSSQDMVSVVECEADTSEVNPCHAFTSLF